MSQLTSLNRRGALIGLAAILGLALIVIALYVQAELDITGRKLGVPLDDAWIHFQFARNLSQGNGFSFNPGVPTPGSTAPLWTVALAVFGIFSQEFMTASLVLSAGFFLLTIVLSYGLTVNLSGRPAVGLIAAIGVLLCGRLVWAGLAGMETTAFAALSVAAVWVYSRKGLNVMAAALFGLASQTRPEGHALFALAIVDTTWSLIASRRQSSETLPAWKEIIRPLAWPIALYFLISLPYALFSLSVTGRPLPNTFYAKVDATELFSFRTLRETLLIHFRDNPVAFVLLIPGFILAWPRSRLLVAWLVVLPVLSAFMVDFVWHHGRYTMPLIPFVMVVAAQGIEWLVMKSPIKAREYIAAVLIVAFILGGALQLPRWARQLGQNSQEILAMDVAIGEWLANNTAPDALVAVDDIGAIGYLSGRSIFDLNGLISPEMWPILHNEPQGHLRSEATAQLLSEVNADYLAIFPLWHWELANNPSVAQDLERFQSETRTIIGEREAVVYRAQWPYLAADRSQTKPVASLGEGIQLVDYELSVPSAGQSSLEVTLFWQGSQPIEESYDVFVHVLNPDGEIVAQADSKPVHGLAPTYRWSPETTVRDPYTIEWSEDRPTGIYEVRVGMYLRESGQRLTVEAANAQDEAIVLGNFNWQDSSGH